jgi:hypothetical protein
MNTQELTREIKDLNERLVQANENIWSLYMNVWLLQNPYKFNVGDAVVYDDKTYRIQDQRVGFLEMGSGIKTYRISLDEPGTDDTGFSIMVKEEALVLASERADGVL